MSVFKETRGVTRTGICVAVAIALSAAFALAGSGLEILSRGPVGSGEVTITHQTEIMSTVKLEKSWENSEVGTVTVTTVQNPGESLADLKARHKQAILDALAEFPEN
jgi:hypothetical protein